MKSSTSLAAYLLSEAGVTLGSRSGTPDLSADEKARRSGTPPALTENKTVGNLPVPATAAMALLNKIRDSYRSPSFT